MGGENKELKDVGFATNSNYLFEERNKIMSTLSHDLKESITFMSIARETAASILEANGATEDLVSYVLNEASDYQIMSLLVNEKMPEEKYNLEEEMKVFDQFKQIVAENSEFLATAFGFGTVYNLIENVQPTSLYGVSTAKPILEHFLALQEQATPAEVAMGQGVTSTAKWRQLQQAVGVGTKEGKSMVARLAELKARLNQMFDKGLDNASTFMSKLKTDIPKYLSDNRGAVAVGGAILAALIAYGLYRIYKNRKNKALQACKDKPGEAKKLCIKNFEKKALKDQINGLKAAKAMCKSSKNPDKCVAALDKKIEKLNKKMAKVG